MICGVPGESTHGPPWQYANRRKGGAFESEDGCPVGAVVVKGNRTAAGSEAATLPNTRMQRTRSSPSALRSPLMRWPLGGWNERCDMYGAGLIGGVRCARRPARRRRQLCYPQDRASIGTIERVGGSQLRGRWRLDFACPTFGAFCAVLEALTDAAASRAASVASADRRQYLLGSSSTFGGTKLLRFAVFDGLGGY